MRSASARSRASFDGEDETAARRSVAARIGTLQH
jgi:hypothetical protein